MGEALQHLRLVRQQGVTLTTSLILLAAIMLLGATTARTTVQGEKAARNERDTRTAFHAAEAALRDAQADIDSDANRKKKLFLPADRNAFPIGCGTAASGNSHGLCAAAEEGSRPAWLQVDLLDTRDASAQTVAFGAYTGLQFAAGMGPLPALPPRYMIELLSHAPEDQPVAGEAAQAVYRITAIGFGMRETTHVVLQAVYRRERIPDESSEPDTLGEGPLYRYRSSRLSWREIPHWQELRDASK